MSKYTTEVRFICETSAGLSESEGYQSVNQIVKNSAPIVFDFDFPIFDENYRLILETKILKHYYTREIGLETVGLWKLKLDTKLNEIMPYYNQLYKSELIEFNPMYDTDLERKHNLAKKETTKLTGTETSDVNKTGNIDSTDKSTTTGTSNETTNTNENSSVTNNGTTITQLHNTTGNTSDETASNTKTHYDKYSDTPQGSLQNVINDTYLTNARMINDTDTKTGKVTVTGNDDSNGTTTNDSTTDSDSSSDTTKKGNTSQDLSATKNVSSTDVEKLNASQTTDKELSSLDDYIEYVKGKNGGQSFSYLLKEFRETFLNIDMMVIGELEELFMMLW